MTKPTYEQLELALHIAINFFEVMRDRFNQAVLAAEVTGETQEVILWPQEIADVIGLMERALHENGPGSIAPPGPSEHEKP
jgi:hypothetical protein